MGHRENKIETFLKKEIERLGGVTYKWVSPGNNGVPDQIVFISKMLYLVELKTYDGRISQLQRMQERVLLSQGFILHFLFGMTDVINFIETVKHDVENLGVKC
jgi:hypothetical protein